MRRPGSIFARALFDGADWHFDARVEVAADGTIVGVGAGRTPGDPVADVLIPGLVNAHCHLELAAIDARPTHFVDWLRAVMAARFQGGESHARRVAKANLGACLRAGATAFGEIDTLGAGRTALREANVAGRCYAELVGFQLDAAAAREAVRRRCEAPGAASSGVVPGLSPHAPYSISPALLEAARLSGMRLAVHVSETAEEVRFLRDGAGPFRDLLEELGKWDAGFRPPGTTPLQWMHALGATGPDVLLIHMHVLGEGDLEVLARCGSPVVVCPGTIDWFGRAPASVEAMLAAGVTVAIGTDSLSSNEELCMFREMALLRRQCPGLAPGTVLRMATSAGGAALGSPSGRLLPGRRFDAVLLRYSGAIDASRLEEWLTGGDVGERALVLEGSLCDGSEACL